jgi:hypothetical protein
MKPSATTGLLFISMLAGSAWAAESAPTANRLTFMVSGASLSGFEDVSGVRLSGDDGGGASVGLLHNFNADAIAGVAAEHQVLGDAHWTFGTLTLAYGRGQAGSRSNFYLEARKGSGEDDAHSFSYSMYTVGLIQGLTRQLSLQIEDKQVDIDTTHGNLPKLGLQFLWSPKLLTSVAYTHSVSPDLGTRLWSARADYYGKRANLLVGGATGKATPAVFDLQTGVTIPGLTTHEVFLGVTKPFSRMEVTLLGDYIELAGIKRFTVTLNGTVRLGGTAR